MDKTYHKNVIEDYKEFTNELQPDWKKSNERAAVDWNEKAPKGEKEFIEYYEKSNDYIEAMATYNSMGKKLRLIEKICKVIATVPDIKAIVDFGCGVGSDSLHLNGLGYKVTAMDVKGRALEFCKYRFEKYASGQITTIPVSIDTKIPKCDLILSLDTLEHVFDPYKTLDQMFEAEPKAILLTTAFGVHDHDNQGGIPMHTDHKVSKVEKYIQEHGYIKQKLTVAFPPRLFIKKRMNQKRTI
jgi:2-polyprenyl-3-methyl-5-hydroxy-6-metoxy-1,4-benzoquinol methylase